MLTDTKLSTIHQLAEQSSPEEIIWMSGYLAGLVAQRQVAPPKADQPKEAQVPAVGTVQVVYATETGNSKKVAITAVNHLKKAGLKTKITAAESYEPAQLSKETHLLLIISTQGEGEPPETAKKLYDFLHHTSTPLAQLHFGIIALGSKSYPLYCQAGIDVEKQLLRLQARAIHPMVKCDDDYEADAQQWIEAFAQKLKGVPAAPEQIAVVKRAAEGKKYFEATLQQKILLNDTGSSKAVYHYEFALPEPLHYTPGNAAGVVPHNAPDEVSRVLSDIGLAPEKTCEHKGDTVSYQKLFTEKVSISHLPISFVKKYAALAGTDIPETRMDLHDLLRIYPLQGAGKVKELLDILPPIQPRLYTIASGPAAHDGQLHLTVQQNRFEVNDKQKTGLGSGYLHRLQQGERVTFFLHGQKTFTLPPPDALAIMIGQGTGIAPFRSFIAEREAQGAGGSNWLYFGEENRVTDFYYQTELQTWHETGVLQKLEVAFLQKSSQPATLAEKITAQGKAIWDALQQGAYLYISGEKEPAGKAIEEALVQVAAQHGQLDAPAAAAAMKALVKEGRYAKELY